MNKDKIVKKKLKKYIKENSSKGYPLKNIRYALINYGLEEPLVNKLIKNHQTKNVLLKSTFLISIVLLVGFVLLLRLPPPIGLAPLPPKIITITESYNYTDAINLTFTESSKYTWLMENYGSLSSLRLDGSISKKGSATVYLEHEDKTYMIFDSSRLRYIEISEPIETKSQPTNQEKSIIITLKGQDKKPIDEIFEFTINAEFNWSVNHEKLCTKWDINDVSLCYGSSDCCSFIDLESLGSWNDIFYLSYGRYNSGLENTIKAQVIYYDVNLSIPYSDIVYSGIAELKANFHEQFISFKDICIDSCSLPLFDLTSYTLVFIIENSTLNIDNIKYSVEKEINISRNPPELIKEFDNITIYKNEALTIDLSQYFYDQDDDELIYYSYKDKNINALIIRDYIVRLIPEYNFTGTKYMYFIAYDSYQNTTSNIFSINVIEKPLKVGDVNVSEELIKPTVIINQPVKWIKKVNSSDRVIDLSVNISPGTLNLTVREIKENRIISDDKLKVNENGEIKNYSVYKTEKRIEQIEKIEDRLSEKKIEIIREDPTAKQEITSINQELLSLRNEQNKLTGFAIVNKGKKGMLTKFFEWLFGAEIRYEVQSNLLAAPTGYAVAIDDNSSITAVIIEDIIEEIEIEYYTEAPTAEEEDIPNGKRIVVSSDTHYEDILAYTYLDDIPQKTIRLYRIIDNSRILIDNVSYYDRNNDGLVDYIEWVIPSLSTEIYEVIIITKAEHLDSNRNLIADIYDSVKALDQIWSPHISEGEYVRVTFEKALDNTRDITIYARSNGSAEIEVYTKNSNKLITKFENVSKEDWYKVYLTNLNNSYDVFDLRVFGAVEFDYIVDPIVTICQDITTSGTYTLNNNLIQPLIEHCINISASDIILDCNGSNITGPGRGFLDTHSGIYVDTQSNITIKNCNIDNFAMGIWFDSTNYSLIINNTIRSSVTGISLEEKSRYNTIMNNSVDNNGIGIYLDDSSYNTIVNNSARYNSGGGIRIDNFLGPSRFNNITGNNFCFNNLEDVICAFDQTTFSDNYCSSGNVCGGTCLYCGDMAPPGINFTHPTPPNNKITTNTSAEIKINITNASDLGEVIWNWNNMNYTFYNDSLLLMFNFDNISALGENYDNTEGYIVKDLSRYNNDGIAWADGTSTAGPLWGSIGRYGGAFNFDGIDDYINVSNDLDLSVLSIEFWFKPNKDYDSTTDYISLIYHPNYEIFIDKGNIVFRYQNNNLSSIADTWNKGQWYHVVATYDGFKQMLYTKGENESSTIIISPIFTVKNSIGENVASFLNSGDIILKGNCIAASCSYPGNDAFVIQDPSGDTVAYINSTGDLCIEDTDCNDQDADCDNPADGSFIVKNTIDQIVSYIDAIGNLCLIGNLTQNGNP